MRYIVEVNGDAYASFIDKNEAWLYSQNWVGRAGETFVGFDIRSVFLVDILNDTVEFAWER